MSEELKAVAHIMDRNVPNAHADGCPGCIDWARRMNEYAAKNPEEFKPIDLIARLNFLRSLPNSQRSNDAIDDAMEEAAEQLADLRARLASVANSVSSPPQNDAGVEGLREALLEKATWFRCCPSTGEYSGEYCSVRPADDHNMVPMIGVEAVLRILHPMLGQEFEAGDTWCKHYDAMAKAAGELKAAIRPQLDAMPYADHAKVRKAFNDIAVVAGRALDFLQGRPLPSAPSGEG